MIGEAVPRQLADGTRLEQAEWLQNGDDLSARLVVRVPVAGDGAGSASVRLATRPLPKSADKPGGRRVPVGTDLPEAVGRRLTRRTATGRCWRRRSRCRR